VRGSGRGGGGEEEEGPSASIELNLGSLISRRIFQDFSGFFRIFRDFSGFFGITCDKDFVCDVPCGFYGILVDPLSDIFQDFVFQDHSGSFS